MTALPYAGEVRAAYAGRGIGGRLRPGRRPAVVGVDLTHGFTDPACPLGADLDEVVAASRTLLDAARAAGRPVVFTTIAMAPDGPEGGVWRQKMPALSWLVPGSRWVDVDPRLGRVESEPVVVKRAASGFAGTGLAALLTTVGADTLILCGATTSGCVRATAVDACAHGWPAFVVRECVGDRAAGPHEASLLDLDAKYADVIGLAEAVCLLDGDRDPGRLDGDRDPGRAAVPREAGPGRGAPEREGE